MTDDISHFGVKIDFANGRLEGCSYRALNLDSLWSLIDICVPDDKCFVFFEIEFLIEKNIQVYFNGENLFCFIHEYETGEILLFTEPVFKAGDQICTIEDERWGFVYFIPSNQMMGLDAFKIYIQKFLRNKENIKLHHFTQKFEEIF